MKAASSMQGQLVMYFLAEKRESLLFMAAGVLAIAVSIALFRSSSPVTAGSPDWGPYRGMIALLCAGIAMTFLFRGRDAPYSAGVGLLIQSSLMLVLDLFAERRADVYLAHIKDLGGG